MFINNEPIELAIKKALELVKDGKQEGYLKEDILGKLSVYIDNKPNAVLFTIDGNDACPELFGKMIYVGGNIDAK